MGDKHAKKRLIKALADQLRQRIALVEGPEWAEADAKASKTSAMWSTQAAIEEWLADFDLGKGAGVIYGHKGFSRYSVGLDGTIYFDVSKNRALAEKAKAAGFRMW